MSSATLFSLLFVISVSAQPEVDQMYHYGGNYGDYLYSSIQTQDGGFLYGGRSRSSASGDKSEPEIGHNSDYWIIKTDPTGIPQWDRTFGGGDSFIFTELRGEILTVLRETENGYFVGGQSDSPVYGTKTEPSYGEFDFWILRLDTDGNILWQKDLGGSDHDEVRTLEPTPDGGCIVGGPSKSGVSGNKTEANRGLDDYWVVKLDANGQIQWQKTMGGDSNDVLSSVLVMPDGYLLAGYSSSGISGDKTSESYGGGDYWLVKLDLDGDEMWQKAIGGNSGDLLYRAIRVDDGFVLGGESYSGVSFDKSEPSRGSADYWLVKTDFDGNVIFDKTYGGSGYDGLYDFKILDDGYIMIGTSESNASGEKSEDGYGDVDGWVVRSNENGDLIWDKTYGGPAMDGLNQVMVLDSNVFMFGGGTYSEIGTGNITVNAIGDYWLVKTQPENLSVPEAPLQRFTVFPNPTVSNVTINLHREAQQVSVSIFNALQQVSNIDVRNVTAVDLPLPDVSGIYFLKIEADGKSETAKVIRQ